MAVVISRTKPREDGAPVYIGIPGKVLVVEGQSVLDTMHAHCSYEARVVNLHAGEAVRYQESPLFLVNREALGQQTEPFLESLCEPICLFRREAVAIAVNRSSPGVPKLADVLRGETENAIVAESGICGRNYNGLIVVVGFDPAKKYIAIDEIRRLRHLADPRRSFRAKSSR